MRRRVVEEPGGRDERIRVEVGVIDHPRRAGCRVRLGVGALVARDALPAERRDRYRPFPFLAGEMTAALAASDLVVGRAGSSTLAEAAAFGLPMVCVPYPHAAGHQRANAEAYAAPVAAYASADGPAEVIVAATFHLIPDDPTAIRARLDEIRRWRQAHQPLGFPSAGSVFRNPAEGPSAGALVDGCGLKGRRIGGAVVSEKHANWILNDEGGSASDVRALAELVQATVERETRVRLVFEIGFMGDWSTWPEHARMSGTESRA